MPSQQGSFSQREGGALGLQVAFQWDNCSGGLFFGGQEYFVVTTEFLLGDQSTLGYYQSLSINHTGQRSF